MAAIQQPGMASAREGAVSMTRWTSALRSAMQGHPGHFQLMAALRRAAYTDDHRLLFVAAGIDPERPLSEQSDSFWWGADGFGRLDQAYGGFARVVRGYDPSHGGPENGPFSTTIDAGCGFGGPLVAACFLPGGDVDDLIEVVIIRPALPAVLRAGGVSDHGRTRRRPVGPGRYPLHPHLHEGPLSRPRRASRRLRSPGATSATRRAFSELILAYLRLVVAAAVRLRGYGLPLGDLIQEGNIGLMEAATRFDPDRDLRFSTYATWWIRAAMQDYILRNWSIVRSGTTAAQKSLFFNLRRLRASASPTRPRRTMSERGDRSVWPTPSAWRRARSSAMEQRLAAGDSSLNAPLGEDGRGQLAGSASPTTVPTPEETVSEPTTASTATAWLAAGAWTGCRRASGASSRRANWPRPAPPSKNSAASWA